TPLKVCTFLILAHMLGLQQHSTQAGPGPGPLLRLSCHLHHLHHLTHSGGVGGMLPAPGADRNHQGLAVFRKLSAAGPPHPSWSTLCSRAALALIHAFYGSPASEILSSILDQPSPLWLGDLWPRSPFPSLLLHQTGTLVILLFGTGAIKAQQCYLSLQKGFVRHRAEGERGKEKAKEGGDHWKLAETEGDRQKELSGWLFEAERALGGAGGPGKAHT
ncbi:hypothetical protein JOQ06_005636, partial [Pogonophryne albipinna]